MNRPPLLIAALAFATAFSILGAANKGQVYNYQARQKKPPLEIARIGSGLYVAKGDWGSNVGFYIANNEVLVIDSKATKDATKKVIEEIGKITKSPITRVVFTHSDPDSFNGREAYPSGAAIICTPGVWNDFWHNATVYLEMNAPADVYDWPKVDFVPTMTFEGRLNVRIGREEVTFLHYGPAHTSGDSIVWFKADKLAFIGDLVFPGREPLIQDQKGGYSPGLVRVLGILLSSKPEIRTFVPSHGDPIGREEVEQCLSSIVAIRDKVTSLFNAGKSLDDVKRALGIREPPKEPGSWVWPSLAVQVYRELRDSNVKK